jgi:type I restriction enzyme R subunit
MSFTEKHLVEDYIVNRLREQGWEFVSAEDLERPGDEEPLLLADLVRAVERINRDKGIGDEELTKVVNELTYIPTGIEGAKTILHYFKFGIPVKFEREREVRRVDLFDFDTIDNNNFTVSRQVHFQGKEKIITDIILYVNGIPLVNIECKNPVSISEDWSTAYLQIKDYEKAVPELYKYVQIGAGAAIEARYFPVVSWADTVNTYEWKEEGCDSIDSLVTMLSRGTLLDILKNFLFFRVKFGDATKVIARYMQYRAANKIYHRVLDHLAGKSDKKNGLIWHWQGSGKTLTMLFAGIKLYYHMALENPTVFFIVDRDELEDQLYQEFGALDLVRPELIESVQALRRVIIHDGYRAKRGIFITLIHKFRPDELRSLQYDLEELSREKETILTRRNIIAFIDEGHRTQYGLLAIQMKALLKSAFFFAFTGTPIAKTGRDTYREFSYLPDEPYLDRYFITDSIEDGFTVKIVYQPRLEDEVHLKKELLDSFLESEFEELPDQIRDDLEERIRKRLTIISVFLENPEIIKPIARDIADHFREHVDGKFKALIVTGSRTACELYKRELDQYLPPEYSEIVMTYTRESRKILQDSLSDYKARYVGRDIYDIRKDTIDKFKEDEYPRILIVTNMLLTGFDAPNLQVMYLHKPLKEHMLLQAVARTNRPYKDLKEAGLIIDYIGVLKEFEKALKIYSDEDTKGALYDYESLQGTFENLIGEILEILADIPRDYERETLIEALEVITGDPLIEKQFNEKYIHVRKLFELLGTHEVKLRYFKEYKWISGIYLYYMKVANQKPSYEESVRRYYDKTIESIYKSTEVQNLEANLPRITVDAQYLRAISESLHSDKEKAANILFALNRLVLVEKHSNPIFESLVEKVARLVEMWKEKTSTYEQLYLDGSQIVNEIASLKERQQELDFSDIEYSILLVLEKKLGADHCFVSEAQTLVHTLKKHMFPGWVHQVSIKKDVEREIRRFARGLKSAYDLTLAEINEIHSKLFESVMHYGT